MPTKNMFNTDNANVQFVINRNDLKEVLRDLLIETLGTWFEQHPITVEKDTPEQLSTPDQVCSRLNISKATLWRWEKRGYLTPVRIGVKVLYKESDILKLMESR